jgi:hypothetical protein
MGGSNAGHLCRFRTTKYPRKRLPPLSCPSPGPTKKQMKIINMDAQSLQQVTPLIVRPHPSSQAFALSSANVGCAANQYTHCTPIGINSRSSGDVGCPLQNCRSNEFSLSLTDIQSEHPIRVRRISQLSRVSKGSRATACLLTGQSGSVSERSRYREIILILKKPLRRASFILQGASKTGQ